MDCLDRDTLQLLLEGELPEVDHFLGTGEYHRIGEVLKARAGQLANFTGIDSPYEAPEAPELRVDTATEGAEDAAERIVAWLLDREG